MFSQFKRTEHFQLNGKISFLIDIEYENLHPFLNLFFLENLNRNFEINLVFTPSKKFKQGTIKKEKKKKEKT